MLHSRLILAATATFASAIACADEPFTITSVMIDEMEYRSVKQGDDPVSWSAAVAVNRGKHSLWFVSEGEHSFGDLGGHELLGFYSYATSSGWNLNAGWRGDSKPEPGKDWALLGIDGELPGSIGVAGTAYFASGGEVAFRLEMERTFIPASNWFLTPELRADFYGQNMSESGRGSGLSALEFAARLGYRWSDNVNTYIGAVWGTAFGTTRDYLEAEGEDSSTTQYLMGISFSL